MQIEVLAIEQLKTPSEGAKHGFAPLSRVIGGGDRKQGLQGEGREEHGKVHSAFIKHSRAATSRINFLSAARSRNGNFEVLGYKAKGGV